MTFRPLPPAPAVLLAAAVLLAPAAAAPTLAASPRGDDRRAIMDALRRRGDLPDRVFVVRSLRVAQGWAWMRVEPQSRDGAQRYEPEAALLRRGPRGWTVVDQPCGEEDCDPARELARIRRAHPAAPAALFRP